MRSCHVMPRATCLAESSQHFPFKAGYWKAKLSSRRLVRKATERTSSSATSKDLLTFEDFGRIAKDRGLHLQLQRLGPFYRIQCRDGDSSGALLGTTNGFTAPIFGLMHCDTMQIYTRYCVENDTGWRCPGSKNPTAEAQVHRRGKGGESGDRVRGGILGLGTLLAAALFSYGYWSGCRKAEILAINDNDYTHRRLKRYYNRMFGLEEVREVGSNGLRDLPDLLVWGGAGTRMNGNLEHMVRKCSKMFCRSFSDSLEQQAPAQGKGDDA